jgi:N-acetylmuramoyl-L-alanine amidase
MMIWDVDAGELVAEIVPVMTVWREASGEGPEGMLAVAWVLKNRSVKRKLTVAEVCLQPWQFSSMNAPKDPAMTHYPAPDDASFRSAYNAWQLAERGVAADPTDHADFYFATTIAEPDWAKDYTFTVQIGRQRFYRS